MKLTKNELLEKINNLNKQKPLKENKEIQRVASPADADALEQHEEALKQNKERLDPKNYAQDVKDLVQETASEESRYRHFDVVDRKDLAKRINEAKEKGLDFKVSRSIKEGFRYTLKVLNEDYMKKEAGDPNINCAAFNKATDVQASSPATGLGEDVENEEDVDTLLVPKPVKEDDLVDYKGLVNEICCWLANNEDVEGVSFPLIDHLVEIGYDEDFVNNLFEHCDDESEEEIIADEPEEEIVAEDEEEFDDEDEELPTDENLDEELKVYTSTLEGFHPSVKCEDFWNEIVENNKVEDLEYALEAIFPDGISDVSLDEFLSNDEDWIRDMIELPYDEEESQENSNEDDESKDEEESEEDTESEEKEESEDDENDYPEEDDIEPDELEFDDESDEKEPSDDETPDDEDDIEPVYLDDEEEVTKEPKKELEEESLETQPKNKTEEIIECDEIDDDKTQSLADGFINKNFKENIDEKDPKAEVKEQLKESEESDDEVVDICEDDVDNMLGCPKKEEEK